MEIAGHVSRQMLLRYAHIRTEAKRKALDEVEQKRVAVREQIQQARQNAAEAETPQRRHANWLQFEYGKKTLPCDDKPSI